MTAANPAMQSFNDLRWSYKLANAATRVWYQAGLVLFMLIRRADLDRTANLVGRLAQRIGPHLRGHRTARANLVAAYPDKSAAEIEHILSCMWENLGRLLIEYVNLDRLVDNANPNGGRIVVTPGTLEILRRLRDDGKPAVLFTSHLSSYELGAIWVKSNGLDLAIFYNPSNFGPLSEELAAMQAKTMGRLVPSGADTVWKLREAMKEGLHLALFADQHFARGVEVMFFDRPCKANPMAARFAQFFDCPVMASARSDCRGTGCRSSSPTRWRCRATPQARSTSRPPCRRSPGSSKAGCASGQNNGSGCNADGDDQLSAVARQSRAPITRRTATATLTCRRT